MFQSHWQAALRFILAKGGLGRAGSWKSRRRARPSRLAVERVERLEDRTLLAAPIATYDMYTLPDDALNTSAESLASVLANDYDYDQDPLTAVLNTNVSHGTLTLNSNGHFTYTPTLGYAGSDSFSYKAFDGTNYSTTAATVSITVTKPLSTQTNLEDRPHAGADDYGPLSVVLQTGDVQVSHAVGDGHVLRYSALSDPLPVIGVEATLAAGTNTVDTIETQLTFDGDSGDSVFYDRPTSTSMVTIRMTQQVDAGALPTGRYAWELVAITHLTTSETATRVYSGHVEIVNGNDSNFGDNWMLADLDRLVVQEDGALLVRGDGVTEWFTESGANFTAPAGPYSTFTLVKNTDNSYTLTDKFGDDEEFSSGGLLTIRRDFNGNEMTYAYVDADNDSVADELSTITDPFGRVTTFAYSSGLLTSITDHANRVTTVAHDTSGRVTSVTAPDPDGSGSLAAPITAYAYSGSTSRLVSITDPLSRATAIAYDFAGRFDEATYADNSTRSFAAWQTRGLVDPASGEGTETVPADAFLTDGVYHSWYDASAHSTSFKLDRFGFRTESVNGLGKTTTWQRNANGLATQVTRPDPDGSGSLTAPVTSFTYDSQQNLTQITFPDSSTQAITYDSSLNRPLTLTDELSRVTEWTYDTAGNRLTETTPLGFVTTWTYNSDGQVTSVTLPDPDGSGSLTSPVTSYTYSTAGLLTEIENPDASTVTFAYDSVERLSSQTDELNRTTSLTYDNLDRLLSVTLPDPDGSGSLTSPVTTSTYDAVGNVLTVTNPASGVTSYSYDALDRLTQVTLPDPDGSGSLTAPVFTRTYVASGHQLASETNALGKTTTYGYDAAGRLTSVIRPDPDGTGPLGTATTAYTYDYIDRLTRITDPLSHQTNFEYNTRDWRTKQTDADPDGSGSLTSPVTEWSYDAAGQLTLMTDPLGRATALAYDDDGRRTTITLPDPDGSGSLTSPVFTTAYDNMGRGTTQTDPLGNVTTLVYNVVSRLTSRTDPDPDGSGSLSAPVTAFAYDAAGQLTSTTDPSAGVTSFAYDNLGRVITTTLPDPDGSGSQSAPVISRTYDSRNNVLTETDPLGKVTSYEYDALSRLTERTEPDPDGSGSLTSPVTTFTYDALNNLLTLTDPDANTTTWTYDGWNQVRTDTNELDGVRSFVYDAVGNVTKITDRNGLVREFVYDNLDRQTAEKWKAGSTVVRTLSYAYDAASQLTSASDPDAALAYTYDGLGRMTSVDNNGTPNVPHVVLNSTYDAASRRTNLSAVVASTADFSNSFVYDNLGRMTRVTQQGQTGGNSVADKRVDLAYTASGEFSTITRYADTTGTNLVATTAYTFDQSHRLTNLDHTKGSTNLANYSWTFDTAGRITAVTSPDGTSSYSYDNTDQLTAADHSYQTDETYAYDANGNRTNSGYTTGTNNRLTSDGTFNYTYDAEGNRTRQTTIASGAYVDYVWDYRNRLTTVTSKTSAGVTTKQVAYTYDVFDRRISKRVDDNGDSTFDRAYRYVYDSTGKSDGITDVSLDDIVFVFDDTGALLNRYLHGPAVDQLFADENSLGEVLWALSDNQGTIRDWAKYNSATNTTSIVNHLKFDSFGRITSQSDPTRTVLYAYTGREWDADPGLFYYRTRWYDPTVGRFIGEDPLGFAAGDTNVSRYVGNNVANAMDPSGLASWKEAWSGYKYYLFNPSKMDPGLYTTFKVATTTAVVAGGLATGGIVYYGPVAACPTFAGWVGVGGATATGTVVSTTAALIQKYQAQLREAQTHLAYYLKNAEELKMLGMYSPQYQELIVKWEAEVNYCQYALMELMKK